MTLEPDQCPVLGLMYCNQYNTVQYEISKEMKISHQQTTKPIVLIINTHKLKTYNQDHINCSKMCKILTRERESKLLQ